jgi:hypothetical protein
MAAMKMPGAIGLVVAALLGGCGGPNVNLQQLLALPAPAESGGGTETGSLAAQAGPHETSLAAEGTPTGVFALVARGALGCWFAADGPLKASHIYRAEAEPPAKGGNAEIAIYERDPATRDLRGPRAYRITFTAEALGVRMTTTAARFELKLAQAMAKDVESWAKGGEGCQLRAVLPPPAPPQVASKASKTAKGQSAAKDRPAPSDKKR